MKDYLSMIRIIQIGVKQIKLNVWDTAGQERFSAISSSLCLDAHGVYEVAARDYFNERQELALRN